MERASPPQTDRTSKPGRSLTQLLDEARSRIERVAPEQALTDTLHGALLIDIRGDTDRTNSGVVPNSLHIPRTVLEWRLAPDSEWRNPFVSGLDERIILLCDHGYSSSLAAATLVDLGFQHVADVIGGFMAWRRAGLPVCEAPPPRSSCDLAGMRPPDSMTGNGPSRSLSLHWDSTFQRQGATNVSWYEQTPAVSLALIEALAIPPNEPVIDIGAGASSLVDCLLERHFSDVSVLDVSDAALRTLADRLAPDAPVTWIRSDVLQWRPSRTYRLWHDRAMFHFLVSDADRQRYLETMVGAVEPGGAVIIGTFAGNGPEHCSGLPVQRYSSGELVRVLSSSFQVIRTMDSDHETPSGSMQPFTWIAARRSA